MKASDFAYEQPDDLSNALALLADKKREIQILAGGQSLMPMMNFRLAQPEVLLDLNRVDELQFISRKEDSLEIGAMTRYAQLEASALIRNHLPLISRALPFIAHSAIRNRGTIGGSAALADPAAEMPALLIALDATIVIRALSGQRHVAAGDFFQGLYETDLGSGELIEYISIPIQQPGRRFGFHELARRHGDYAMAGSVVTASCINPLEGLRIVFFAVSDRPLRATTVEEVIPDTGLSDEVLLQAHAQIDQLDFHGDLNADEQTKSHLAKVVFKRAFEELMA